MFYNNISRYIKQQKTLNSNIGRYDTCVRWCIEYQISKINVRYALFANKIPYHWIIYTGGALRYCISTHNHFNIGLIKTSKSRALVLSYIDLCIKNWVDHPISDSFFRHINLLISNKSPIFKHVKTRNDILKYWSINTAKFWNLTYPERYIKGGGSGNIKKAIMALYQSQNVIKLFIGTGIFYNIYQFIFI